MATENIVSKVYRVLTDVSSRVWDKISFWCLAKDVELANGKNLETTCGSITGITSSLTSTSTTMAASASAIKQLNDKIADLNSNLIKYISDSSSDSGLSHTVNIPDGYKILMGVMGNANSDMSLNYQFSSIFWDGTNYTIQGGQHHVLTYDDSNNTLTGTSSSAANTKRKRWYLVLVPENAINNYSPTA